MSKENQKNTSPSVNKDKRKVFAVSCKNPDDADELYKYVKFRVNKGLSKDRGEALTDLLNEVRDNPLLTFFRTQ